MELLQTLVGVYPVTIWVDVFTHGSLDLGLIQYPIYFFIRNNRFCGAVNGYKIIVVTSKQLEIVNSNEFTLLQN